MHTFYNCSNLEEVYFSKTINYVSENAFDKCDVKTAYIAGDGITFDKLNDGIYNAEKVYNYVLDMSKINVYTTADSQESSSQSNVPTVEIIGINEYQEKKDTGSNNGKEENIEFKKFVLKGKKKALVVTWKAVKNVTGYQIQISTNKKFKKNKKIITVAKKKATKKTVKKLKSKKKYYVRVRAYKVINGKKVYGKWSKVKTVTTK